MCLAFVRPWICFPVEAVSCEFNSQSGHRDCSIMSKKDLTSVFADLMSMFADRVLVCKP